MQTVQRIKSLDYLRGLMALGIMIYHYFSWTFHSYNSETLLGVLGIYGVSVFYVLSGLTLFHVYDRQLSGKTLFNFTMKRIFRIIPLLALSVFLNIFLLGKSYDLQTIFLNITGLFGFFDHDNYITTGAWSIGNELVFYAIFPLILLGRKFFKYSIEIFFILGIIIALYYAFIILDPKNTLGEQRSHYIHPMNQFYLFAGGIFLGKYFKDFRSNWWSFILLAIIFIVLTINPVKGDKILLVSSFNRILYSILTFGLTLSFLIHKSSASSNILNSIFLRLGDISYSVYLLHAVVFWGVNKYTDIDRFSTPILFLSVCVVLTFCISALSYYGYERPWSRWGKRLISQPISKESR